MVGPSKFVLPRVSPRLVRQTATDAADMQEALVADRRYFHANPELGWQEKDTTALVARRLAEIGYRVIVGAGFLRGVPPLGVPEDGLAPTGCVAEIEGRRPGPTVALRVDLDALPIAEATTHHRPADQGWRSHNSGIMHACGHDGHTAIGLATARLLAKSMPEATGKLRLIFQPAEEGARGARSVVDAGWLADVDMLLALHIGLGVPSGTVALGTTGFLPTRKYRVVLKGRAAHAGKSPELGRNALLCACQLSLALHVLAQWSVDGVRINVGTLQAGGALNVVADSAEIRFEARAPNENTLNELTERALRLVQGIADANEISVSLTLIGEATEWRNDTALVEWAKKVAEAGTLFNNYLMNHEFGASEDATLMLRAVHESGGLGGYFVLGADLSGAHHTPTFDFDERVLVNGTALIAALLRAALLWSPRSPLHRA